MLFSSAYADTAGADARKTSSPPTRARSPKESVKQKKEPRVLRPLGS